MKNLFDFLKFTFTELVFRCEHGDSFEFCYSNSYLEFKFVSRKTNLGAEKQISGEKIQISDEKNEFLRDRGGMGGSLSNELDLNLNSNSLNTDNIGVIQTGEGDKKEISGEKNAAAQPKKRNSRKKTNFTPINSQKIQILEYVWMLPATRDSYIEELGQNFFDRCAQKLNAWVGADPTAERIRKGQNAGHTFRSWVINAVAKEKAEAKKLEPKKSQQEKNLEILFGEN